MTTADTAVPSSWSEVAPPRVPPNVHVVAHGQTLTSIAELLGHPGEWRALFHHNVPEAARDRISPDALPVGAWLNLPPEWRGDEASSSSLRDAAQTEHDPSAVHRALVRLQAANR